MPAYKVPESVLVIVHTGDGEVLLLERADHPGFWQSITGSRASLGEPLRATCAREVTEETGLPVDDARLDDWQLVHRYEIYPHWRKRYAPGVTQNTEHVFGLRVDAPFTPTLAPHEHTAFRWLPWREAADCCFSWTNAQAIRRLQHLAAAR